MERSEALEIVREYYPSSGKDLNKALETLIPELKESEDERIRKVLYGWVYTMPSSNFEGGFSREEILAWLEKQGSQKPAWNEEDEKMIGRIRGIIERYAFSQSAVDVNGELCEREFVEPDEWLKSLKKKMHLEAE